MRYTLKDYQAEAVREALQRLTQARDMHHRFDSLSQFSLAATTGAGKTVMAAAIIEALFFGSDEFDFQADPGATVLWFSDSPDLNEQSRARIQAAASELDSRLRVVEATFSEPSFKPGMVYFLNAQKLSKNSRLVRGERTSPGQERLFEPAPDMVQQTIYDVISNTVQSEGRTLYFILDEAHRGMKTASDRQTIVQRLINGANGTPPMPVVFGISATVDRFTEAMKKVTNRTALPAVEVDSSLVQASGLLKDDIVLTIPKEKGVFDTTLLRRAVQKVKESTEVWAAYGVEQEEPDPVVPLMVVQMGDAPSQDDLTQVLDVIYDEWPDLPGDAVAHVFGSHADLLVGQQPVPYVEPQRVQDATHIRVLLAIEAISTGWDCPRAEVLVSFRTRNEPTYIHQLLGRMLRTPLARRISGNEVLNSVDCLLPHFDRETSTGIAQMLMKGKTAINPEDGDDEEDTTRRVLFDPVRLDQNPGVPQEVWDLLVTIPSVTIPKAHVKPIRRLDALAIALSNDRSVPGAVDQARQHLCKVLDGQAAQHDEKVASARTDVLTMTGEEVRGRLGAEGFSYDAFEMSADERAIHDSYRLAGQALTPALAKAYVEHDTPPDAEPEELLEAEITVASLGAVSEVVSAVERAADDLAKKWLSETRVARKGLPDERQAEYDRLEGMSTEPERITLTEPKTAQADTKVREKDGTERDLPTRRLHLMAAKGGTYPIDLNDWERKVLDSEMKQPGFAAWYRNPSRATKESLAVAYKDAEGTWRALRPDFIFFATQHDGTHVADLVDPHGHHLADALPKLRGLVEFAEQFGGDFRRIESVAETNGRLRALDLTKANVRQAIRDATSAKGLYESDAASDY
ncbi:type III restriction endonuclease subunit R [Serinicoccus sp. CNJ-927]|uniref:DEAD/DEAH box helicase n=1 Tax=Serinicoccus sp. CNJ-927 TaxID=1904970 RepID=UPI000962325B|nr:DEAD/DEAH box helicase family protein [Serinicoccus sp. CNJ-927]OLT39428.1 type III restriction endonuclease subunit R [Serinicoccus sp. CNJ-927]